MEEIYVIAGLGNPGKKYIYTRHNVGFWTIDVLTEKLGISIRKTGKIEHKAITLEGFLNEKKVLLVKPQTYMNASGESIRDILAWYGIPVERLILVYDDSDLPLGKIRVRRSGSAGTHNGMKSVIYQLQADCFPRVRIGIGKPPENVDMVDYVLGEFTPEERDIVFRSIMNAARAVITIIEEGIDMAMAEFNSKTGENVKES
ncbi:MAG: aminoacyl-tRNA hydrolase [Clostridiaceae bacterium]|nr:aminoacyl-tRNA hydrolase [Clostridiaceae bacterium]